MASSCGACGHVFKPGEGRYASVCVPCHEAGERDLKKIIDRLHENSTPFELRLRHAMMGGND
jgi:predicted  nucleic acid-binding Zn-ribbon protein